MKEAICVQGLCKSYKNKYAVCDLSFSVYQGEIFGVVGKNGAGKTTTIEMLEGIRIPDSGTITILGLDPQKDRYDLNERIGVQFQTTSIQEQMKVDEALDLFSSFYKKQLDHKPIMRLFGLEDYATTLFKDLSGGWKQRLMLALAIIHDPEIIFLDEPTTGLDPQARRDLWDIIRTLRDQGKTIVINTHYMEEAERLCDRVAMLKQGQLALLDTPANLIAKMEKCLSFSCEKIDLHAIKELESVEKVELSEGMIRVYSSNLQLCTLHVLQLAEARSWILKHMKFEMGTLDDLFIQVATQKGEASSCDVCGV